MQDYGKTDSGGDHARADQREIECALIPRKGEDVVNGVHVIRSGLVFHQIHKLPPTERIDARR